MAYKVTVNKSCSNRDVFLTELWSKLSSMGWTLVDGSCTPVTVAYTAVSIANDTFTSVGHTFVDGQPVQLKTTGTAPGGLAVLTQYYVVSVSGDTFKLSATYNGAAINITSQGTGNHTITEAFRVYKSNGENSDKIYQYIKIHWFGSLTVTTFIASYYYNSTTHAQVGAISTVYIGSMTSSESGFYAWIYGDKDAVFIIFKVGTAYTGQIFGHMVPCLPDKTTLTADATSGNNATLTVTSTEIFEVGSRYQIVGASGEGRDSLTIASIVSSTQLTVSNLPRNYATGALFGDHPAAFGVSRSGAPYTIQSTCPALAVGTDDTTQYNSNTMAYATLTGNVDPDQRTNKYALQPLWFTAEFNNVNSTAGLGCFAPDNFLLTPSSVFTNEDTISVYKKDSGTSSGSNSTTTLNDTSKSWTVNAFAGMAVVISFGTGLGQISKIISNTATQLTLDSDIPFAVVPDSVSQYVICSKAYRYFDPSTLLDVALREGF